MAKKGHFKKGAKKDSIRQRKYNGTSLQKKRRAARNKARRKAMRKGLVRKGDGKDVDHVNRRSLKGRTRIWSRKRNRARNSPIFTRRRRKRR